MLLLLLGCTRPCATLPLLPLQLPTRPRHQRLLRAANHTCQPPSFLPSLPYRPDKNTLDQQLGKSDFVELRRADLERYLRKLAAHPVVGASEVGGLGRGAGS